MAVLDLDRNPNNLWTRVANLEARLQQLERSVVTGLFPFDSVPVFPVAGWEDLRIPLEQGRVAGGTVPSWAQVTDDGAGSKGVYSYHFANGEEIWFTAQFPHAWKTGTFIFPHLHWQPTTNSNPSDNVGIGLEYTWVNPFDTLQNTTIITRDVPTGVNAAYDHLIHNFDNVGIDGDGFGISSMILCRFFRQAATVNDYPDEIVALEIDFHIEIDSIGSDETVSKSF